jgi:hypothetical protein
MNRGTELDCMIDVRAAGPWTATREKTTPSYSLQLQLRPHPVRPIFHSALALSRFNPAGLVLAGILLT